MIENISSESNKNNFLTDKEIDDIINKFSDDIIFENFKEQIIKSLDKQDDTTSKYNYFDLFEERYNYVINNYHNEVVINKINNIRVKLYSEIFALLQSTFKFEMEFNESILLEEQFDYVRNIYKFFIINLDDHCKEFLFNYFLKEEKQLIKKYKPMTNKKDITYSSIKKHYPLDNAVILSNFNNIIDSINCNNLFEFVSDAISNDTNEYTNVCMNELFLMPDTYCSISVDHSIMDEIKEYMTDIKIRFSLRNRLFKYYDSLKGDK